MVKGRLGQKVAIDHERDFASKLNFTDLIIAIVLGIIIALDACAIHLTATSLEYPSAWRRSRGRSRLTARHDVLDPGHFCMPPSPDARVVLLSAAVAPRGGPV